MSAKPKEPLNVKHSKNRALPKSDIPRRTLADFPASKLPARGDRCYGDTVIVGKRKGKYEGSVERVVSIGKVKWCGKIRFNDGSVAYIEETEKQ